MKLREEACDLRTSTCTRPQMLVFCSKSGVSPIFHRVCCEASHSSQSLKPTLTPHLLCLSSLSANDLASFSQRKCRETSLSSTYTLTCDYNHPTLLLEERSQCPVQTNPSHMCQDLIASYLPRDLPPRSTSFPSPGSSPLTIKCGVPG